LFFEGDAFILKTTDYSETSLIVTFFMAEFGRVQALAKGARREKGSFRSTFDLLSRNKIKVFFKQSTSLGQLRECLLLETAQNLARDKMKFLLAEGLLELLRVLVQELKENRQLFKQTQILLAILRQAAPERAQNYWMGYVLQALKGEGLLADFRFCSRSRERLKDGYLLCARQHPEFVSKKSLKEDEYDVHYVSPEDLKLLIALSSEPLERLRFYQFEKKGTKRLLTLIKILTEASLEWRPRTFGKILKTVQETMK